MGHPRSLETSSFDRAHMTSYSTLIETLASENQIHGAIVRRYLREPTFSCFDTIPECDRHTHTHTHTQPDRHKTTAYTTLSIASRSKNY